MHFNGVFTPPVEELIKRFLIAVRDPNSRNANGSQVYAFHRSVTLAVRYRIPFHAASTYLFRLRVHIPLPGSQGVTLIQFRIGDPSSLDGP